MMKFILLLFFVFALKLNANNNSIVAIVGDGIITSIDLENRMKVVSKVNNVPKLSNDELDLFRSQTLSFMIDEMVKIQYGKNLNIKVTDAMIKDYIENLKKTNKRNYDIIKSFYENDDTKNQIQNQITSEIIWYGVVDGYIIPKIKMSKTEIEAYKGNIDGYYENKIQDMSQNLLNKIKTTMFIENKL